MNPKRRHFRLLAGWVLAFAVSLSGLGQPKPPSTSPGRNQAESERLSKMLDHYYEERMALFPYEATYNGDHRYDDRLANDISDAHRSRRAALADRYLRELSRIDRKGLNETDRLSYDVLTSDLKRIADGLKFPDHWLPVGSMVDVPTLFARLGSGNGIQPFTTVRDYEKFLGRARDFAVWVDTAIANMRKGAASGVVHLASSWRKARL